MKNRRLKNLTFSMLAMLLMVGCTNEKSDEAASMEAETGTSQDLPYKATYSSSFEMGKPEHAHTILSGSWKEWEENRLDNMANWAADSIVAFHSDNTMVEGVDSLQAAWKRARAKYSNVVDSINAVMPVYSKDRKENWVLVWATEYNTKLDGKTDTVDLMETWRINKDGKADMLLQYERKTRL